MGVKVLAQYAVLGPYDIVNIVRAPDNRTIVHRATQFNLARQYQSDYSAGYSYSKNSLLLSGKLS